MVVYVIYQQNRWMSFEWIARDLDRASFSLHVVLLYDGHAPYASYLEAQNVPVHHVQFTGLSDWRKAVPKLARYLREVNARIVHTHFINAGLVGLPAAWLAGVAVRLYTRHHAGKTPWHPRGPMGLMLDRVNNFFATRVIAPSRLVESALLVQDGAPPQKVVVNNHGFDLKTFTGVTLERVTRQRQKHGINGRPVIGVVARYLELKGIHYTIEAFARLRGKYPEALLLLANAFGPYRDTIRTHLSHLPQGSYVEIPFEEDIPALFHTFDLFVHVPLKDCEAFGQVFIESLSCGIPSVFTPTGIAKEFVTPGIQALIVDFQDAAAIEESMYQILDDSSLRQSLIESGKRAVLERFTFARHLRDMENLYLDLCGQDS